MLVNRRRPSEPVVTASATTNAPFPSPVVGAGDAPLGGQRVPLRGERRVENRLLLRVQEPGQVDPGAGDDLGEEGIGQRHREGRDHFEAVLVDVLQFVKPGPDPQRVEDGLFPGVLGGHRADSLAESVQMDRHGGLLIRETGNGKRETGNVRRET